MSAPSEDVILHSPDAHDSNIELDIDKFMGTWLVLGDRPAHVRRYNDSSRHVTHSTLPLWTTRKDVSITYTLRPSSAHDATLQFDDVVEYRSKSDLPTSKRSRIVGVDTLLEPPDSRPSDGRDHATSTPRPTQARFKWRGKGWLVIASSRWQVLGCSRDPSPNNPSAWAVTYFEKPPESVLEEIIGKIKALGGDVARLADTFFEVERSGVPMGKRTAWLDALQPF
ncbi:hypothetical protein BD414DRAFT_513470 [Trametes punicea]|nr:hypothetical protein BD414DRAFT_513470 [Trametes punicea]